MLTCPARWAFRYGGQLTGGAALKEKAIAPMLSEGRAWGAMIATWHTEADHLDAAELAIAAMDESLEADAERQREHGVHDQEAHNLIRERLLKIMLHQIGIVEPTKMADTEHELLVSIPSRTGERSSNRYKLLAYVDAVEYEDLDEVWLDEFKLRSGTLTPVKLIVASRQLRWYAWAYERKHGKRVEGVWLNERLNEYPHLPRMVKTGRKDGSLRPSHAVDQITTASNYRSACLEYGEEPHEETLEALKARRWHQRVPVQFARGELEEAGKELVSAARLIAEHEAGNLYPLRNVRRENCNRCPYRDICAYPEDDLIDSTFERQTPKGQLGVPALGLSEVPG